MLDADVKIRHQMEDSRFDARNERVAYVRVEFMVGEDGPFFERFDRESFTEQTRDSKLNALARELRHP